MSDKTDPETTRYKRVSPEEGKMSANGYDLEIKVVAPPGTGLGRDWMEFHDFSAGGPHIPQGTRVFAYDKSANLVFEVRGHRIDHGVDEYRDLTEAEKSAPHLSIARLGGLRMFVASTRGYNGVSSPILYVEVYRRDRQEAKNLLVQAASDLSWPQMDEHWGKPVRLPSPEDVAVQSD